MKDYKKILEGVVNIVNTTEKSDIGFANICTYIGENCPELIESEDEQHRKFILEYLYDGLRKSDEQFKGQFKSAIAWIEKQGEQKSFDYENANIPQKDSTWSEEDKHWMQEVIDFMNHPDFIKTMPTLAKDTINWLKSLKDRVQPQSKQEWSEEDESNFQGIIDELKENKTSCRTDYEHQIYYRLLSWFKSLKERYVWKPSDEQIDVLEHFVRSIGESGFASPYDDNTRLLYSLLKQLKKL